MQNNVIKKISDLAESVLSDTDFFLIDVEVKGGKQPVVWVYVDAEDRGVNMDECAKVSNELSFLLEAHELFNGQYRLNVSSPGLARPLTDQRQYGKNKGRKARVKYRAGEEYKKVEGTLLNVHEQKIIIEQQGGDSISIPFEQIVETKIIPSL